MCQQCYLIRKTFRGQHHFMREWMKRVLSSRKTRKVSCKIWKSSQPHRGYLEEMIEPSQTVLLRNSNPDYLSRSSNRLRLRMTKYTKKEKRSCRQWLKSVKLSLTRTTSWRSIEIRPSTRFARSYLNISRLPRLTSKSPLKLLCCSMNKISKVRNGECKPLVVTVALCRSFYMFLKISLIKKSLAPMATWSSLCVKYSIRCSWPPSVSSWPLSTWRRLWSMVE